MTDKERIKALRVGLRAVTVYGDRHGAGIAREALRADDEAARRGEPCPHCPDGHRRPGSRPFAVYVGPERDADGQPTTIHVQYAAGHHVSEAEAEFVRKALAPAPPSPEAREAARRFIDESMWSEGEDGLDWCVNLPDYLARPPDVQAAIRDELGGGAP